VPPIAPLALGFSGNLAATVPGSIVERAFENYSGSDGSSYELHYFMPTGGTADAQKTLSFEMSDNSSGSEKVVYYPAGKAVAVMLGQGPIENSDVLGDT